MVVRCYACKKRFKSNLKLCPHCRCQNLKVIPWIPEDIKIKHAENYKLFYNPPTIQEIKQYAYDAAKDCDFQIKEITVTDDFEGVIEIMQVGDDFHKINISFNPHQLTHFNVNEIRAMIRHEILHPITMQEDSRALVTDVNEEIQNLQVSLQTAFDEMINYKEYVRRFPNDPDLHSAKRGVFTNFSLIFLGIKNALETNQIHHDHPRLFVQTLAIYEDAVYNFFEDSATLEDWVYTHSAQALYTFLQWIHEDFNIIQDNVSSRDEMREIIFLTFKIMVTVSIDKIYTSNILEFNERWSVAIEHCQRHYNNTLGVQLLSLWKKRFNESPKRFLHD